MLAPVANNQSGIDWEAHQDEFRELVLDTLERKTGFQNVRQHIEVERMITPKQWEEDLYVYEGATFNLGHQLTQMMVLRPHNEFDELKHCWLVGGGTHPGSGLPTILESARITTNAILKKRNIHTKQCRIKKRGAPHEKTYINCRRRYWRNDLSALFKKAGHDVTLVEKMNGLAGDLLLYVRKDIK